MCAAAQDGSGIIVRTVNMSDAASRAKITFAKDILKAYITNLAETDSTPAEYSGGTVEFTAEPWQIKTLRTVF